MTKPRMLLLAGAAAATIAAVAAQPATPSLLPSRDNPYAVGRVIAQVPVLVDSVRRR
ncbi:MAG: hypothetical protein IT562_21895 [Alphaproteobacteria bacterium]|nr:hypothetical protein [Alphaproteobacteria bacterium]